MQIPIYLIQLCIVCNKSKSLHSWQRNPRFFTLNFPSSCNDVISIVWDPQCDWSYNSTLHFTAITIFIFLTFPDIPSGWPFIFWSSCVINWAPVIIHYLQFKSAINHIYGAMWNWELPSLHSDLRTTGPTTFILGCNNNPLDDRGSTHIVPTFDHVPTWQHFPKISLPLCI